MSVLDNPIWHALAGPQQTLAERRGRAVRFDPDYAPFAAVPDDDGPDDWAALRELVGAHGMAVLASITLDLPDDWESVFAMQGVQMVWAGDEVRVDPSLRIERLGTADVPDVLRLVELTKPGPFESRTIELGPYFGIRDEGTLIAMAGCRMHVPGYVEVSAVCTAPTHRGRGLGGALVNRVVADILERGETPCLHAVADNTNAIRLYDELGFTGRPLPFCVARPR